MRPRPGGNQPADRRQRVAGAVAVNDVGVEAAGTHGGPHRRCEIQMYFRRSSAQAGVPLDNRAVAAVQGLESGPDREATGGADVQPVQFITITSVDAPLRLKADSLPPSYRWVSPPAKCRCPGPVGRWHCPRRATNPPGSWPA